MILYHGTGSRHLDSIRRTGLQPRRITTLGSNWEDNIESKPNFVYLTDSYPVYYAMNPALAGNDRGESHIVVIKVDVDEAELYPDEDYIAWEMARNDAGLSIRELIAAIDPADYREHWASSLGRNGVVCTPAVSPEQIIDYRIIDAKNYKLLYAIGGDAMPTPLNYCFMGGHYRRCIGALFEHGEDAALQAAASYGSIGDASGSVTEAILSDPQSFLPEPEQQPDKGMDR